jgi:hypothetical protein
MGTIQGMYPMMVTMLTETYHINSINKWILCDSVEKPHSLLNTEQKLQDKTEK